MNTQKQIFLIVVLFFMLVGSCAAYTVIDLPYRAGIQEEYQEEQSIERGALLFANNCRTCHGLKGEGGVGLTLNKADFQDQDPLKLKATRDLLRRTIYCGRAGTLMQAWLNTNGGSLNERQIDHIIDLITSPVDPNVLDSEGNVTSKGWLQAVEFGHNLNRGNTAVVSGDTLDSIARVHGTGLKELSEVNGGLPAGAVIEKNTKVQLPASAQFPSGRVYEVFQENETLEKIEASQHVGASILADLNQIPYRVDTKRGTFTIYDDKGVPVPGLFPGATIALPRGSTYVVRATDTVDSIAQQHNVSASSIQGLNGDVLGALKSSDPIPFERTLALPSGAFAVAEAGDTPALIASRFSVKETDLAAAIPLPAQVKLPAAARYKIQAGDTALNLIGRIIGGITAEQLAAENKIQPGDILNPDVVLKLPDVDRYVVKGQTMEEVAKAYSNVTAASLAQANGITPDLVLAVNSQLKLPADAWGTAPPDTKNAGTACVQNAIPAAVYETLPGVGTPAATVAPPTEVSKEVVIEANANDWTVVADGKKQEPNKGAVLVTSGTVIKFKNNTGLHTITLNGKKDNGDLKTGDTRDITFAKPSDRWKITCDYHPSMLADVFIQ